MDGSATMSEIRQSFRTPVRILLPKILKSRDDGKAKSRQQGFESRADPDDHQPTQMIISFFGTQA